MKRPFSRFLIRWFVCGLGLWISAGLLSGSVSYDSRLFVIIISGLILAVVNAIIKPIVIILSLPARSMCSSFAPTPSNDYLSSPQQ